MAILVLYLLFFVLAGTLLAHMPGGNFLQTSQDLSAFTPGKIWLDDRGEQINAHGGGIYYENGVYYWFGEKRGAHASLGVNVYASHDLYHWTFEALALAPSDDPASDIALGCRMERPKVLYNEQTGKYVMWFHLELKGQGYRAARAAVAVADRVTGPYRFLDSFRPNGHMSRDMTLFQDDDGAAYHIYASRDNYDLRIARLSDDYLTPTPRDSMVFSEHREAPAIFKRNGIYYLITSGCTGWSPNAARLHTANSIWGPWTRRGNPMQGAGADSTFGAQSTFVLPVQGRQDAFIFMADWWNPRNLQDSRYVWLPVQFESGLPVIRWVDHWNLDWFRGP